MRRRRVAGIVAAAWLGQVAASRVAIGAETAAASSPASSSARDKGKSKAKAKGKRAAADAPAPKHSALPPDRLEALRLVVAGADDAGAIEAATALGASGASNAGEPLVEALATGCSPGRTEATLDALGKLADSGALVTAGGDRTLEILELYAGHRVPDVRRRAIKALGALRDVRLAAATTPLLITRLGDAAPEVRAAAGEALAARRETKASPRLFALLKRGDAAAAGPLAALATPDLVPQIAELAGTVDDGLLATTLGEYVKRDDVPDKLRVDVLRTIGGLGGADATTALVEYVASVPAKDNRPSKREAQKLLDQRGSGKP